MGGVLKSISRPFDSIGRLTGVRINPFSPQDARITSPEFNPMDLIQVASMFAPGGLAGIGQLGKFSTGNLLANTGLGWLKDPSKFGLQDALGMAGLGDLDPKNPATWLQALQTLQGMGGEGGGGGEGYDRETGGGFGGMFGMPAMTDFPERPARTPFEGSKPGDYENWLGQSGGDLFGLAGSELSDYAGASQQRGSVLERLRSELGTGGDQGRIRADRAARMSDAAGDAEPIARRLVAQGVDPTTAAQMAESQARRSAEGASHDYASSLRDPESRARRTSALLQTYDPEVSMPSLGLANQFGRSAFETGRARQGDDWSRYVQGQGLDQAQYGQDLSAWQTRNLMPLQYWQAYQNNELAKRQTGLNERQINEQYRKPSFLEQLLGTASQVLPYVPEDTMSRWFTKPKSKGKAGKPAGGSGGLGGTLGGYEGGW